jgi:hypothetical protein
VKRSVLPALLSPVMRKRSPLAFFWRRRKKTTIHMRR